MKEKRPLALLCQSSVTKFTRGGYLEAIAVSNLGLDFGARVGEDVQ